MRQIVLDTETTGREVMQGHRIIEIGCVELINRRLTGKHYHQYLNPQRESEPEALAVHGLTQAFLADKPLFSHIAEDFLRFIDGAQLIIHNAPFDIGFLEAELNLAAKTHQSITEYCTVLDTLPLARQLHPRQRNSLDALCKRYSIDNSHRELHGALLDAELLARVYLAMTGGQSSLFDETILAQPVMHKINQQQVLSIEKSLVVRYADEEELSAHQAYLEKILQKNKSHCLWLQHYPHTQTVEEIS